MELTNLLDESGNEEKVEAIEERIAESIEEAIEEELFFSLPTDEIVKILHKSDISNAETYHKIINRICHAKGREAALVLNVVETKEATLEECVKIISSLKCSPVCVRLGDLYEENEKQPEIDYEHEIFKLKQKIEEQQKEIDELKQQNEALFRQANMYDFQQGINIIIEPYDYENDIHIAAEYENAVNDQFLV